MTTVPSPTHHVRLGEFVLDLDSGELVRGDERVRLQVQSLELLKALLEQPGRMVSREALRQRLWPSDTFVDFEHGLNAAVRRLREALGDAADEPRFIETIPRKGYRLVARIDPPPIAAGPTADPTMPATTPLAGPTPGPRPAPARRLWLIAGSLALLLALAAGVRLRQARRPHPERPPVGTFTIDVPAGWDMRPLDMVALSPDGRYVAFTAVGPAATRALWVRPLAETDARELVSTGNPLSPFWSPDGSRIGFFQPGQIASVSLADASTQVLSVLTPTLALSRAELSKLDVSDPLLGALATWMDSGDILFSRLYGNGLERLERGASVAERVPFVGDAGRYRVPWPSAIPGGASFAFVEMNRGASERVGRIGHVGTSTIVDLPRVDSRLVVTRSGHAVFVRDGTLLAQRLDERRGLVGSPMVLADDVAVRAPMLGHFSATSDVLAYLTRDALRVDMGIDVVDRAGTKVGQIAGPGFYTNIRLSPDGSRLAVAAQDRRLGTRDVWIYDVAGTPPLRLTFDPGDDMSPTWSPDGRVIFFSSDRAGERDIYQKDVDARRPETLVFASGDSKSLNTRAPDGRTFVYDTGARGSVDAQGRFNRADLFTLFLDHPRRVQPLATTMAHEAIADIAPDGTLVAYHSSEGGSTQIFVETFPDKGGRWQVTTTGGLEPLWRADGRELFFLTDQNEIAAVDVIRSPGGVRFGPQRVLFKRPGGAIDQVRSYAPFPDGRRFALLTTLAEPKRQHIVVRLNWRSALPDP
jgi:Tol biopolymer transport system component/DNA-binding winged helix-turn-helix (wHTH) protein